MKYHFHPEAQSEFNEAVIFYDGCQEGLGLDYEKRYSMPYRTSSTIHLRGHLYPKTPEGAF
jgi:hypothetical protein